MYGKPFNENRPFGTVMGDERFHYEQDGNLYNALKEPVDGDGKILELDPGSPKASVEVPIEAATAASNPADDIPADEQPFNLLAWAQGDESLAPTPFAKVKAETARLIEDMTGITSKETARKAILAFYNV